MNILLTGGSGFLGKRIFATTSIEHEVITLGRSDENDIRCDLSLEIPEIPEVELVIHNAGKAHSFPKTEEEGKKFYDVNYEGTKNLCKSLENRKERLRTIIFVSTVAVYGRDSGENISEEDELLGTTPYAESKILAERHLNEWGELNEVNILILRLPLVFGFEAPGNLGDLIKNYKRKIMFYAPLMNQSKSMVYVNDLANQIVGLGQYHGTFNLSDGHHPKLLDLFKLFDKKFGRTRLIAIPNFAVRLMAQIGDLLGKIVPINSVKLNKLSKPLTFSDKKARQEIGWTSTRILDILD